MTTLSVVMAAYNEQEHIGGQLAALLGQSRQPDQWVLMDDGSTDQTPAFLAQIPDEPRGRVARWRYLGPSGPVRAVNRAAQSATGDWLFIASANDRVQPGAFAAWEAEVARWPGALLMCGDLVGLPLGWSPTSGYLSPSQLRKRWAHGSIIHGASVFIRRSAWEAALGYRADLEWLADWWLYHSLALQHGAVYLAQPISEVQPWPSSYCHGWRDGDALARVTQAVARYLNSSAHADVRDGFLSSGLLDIPEAGGGIVKRLLREAVRA